VVDMTLGESMRATSVDGDEQLLAATVSAHRRGEVSVSGMEFALVRGAVV